MADIIAFLNTYKDGVPVRISIDTKSAVTLSASLLLAGTLTVLVAKLIK